MKSVEEYNALLQTLMNAMNWDDPEKNPYYLWLEERRNNPSVQTEMTFAHFVKDKIMKFYSQ